MQGDKTSTGFGKPCHHIQQRGFTTTRVTDYANKLTRLNAKINVFQNHIFTLGSGVDFRNPVNGEEGI